MNNIDKKFASSSFNARLLFKELTKNGFRLSKFDTAVIARRDKIMEIFLDVFSSVIPYPVGILCDDKYYSKTILKNNGFKVNQGEVFNKSSINQAVKYAKKIKFPVVLKPTVGSHGNGVYTHIKSGRELKQKIAKLLKNYGNGYFLVEKQNILDEFRLFITSNGFFACVKRVPANVTGDGKSTIEMLAEKINTERMNPRTTCLCTIWLDDIALDFLKKGKKSLKYIPQKGEKVFVRGNSNVTTGGNCYEVTQTVHPGYKLLAKKILNSFSGMPFIGIDLFTNDIRKFSKNYSICEINSAPGLSLHMLPEKGKPMNVAKAIVESLFT